MQLINALEAETGKFWTLYAKNGENNTCEVWPYKDRNYIYTTMNNDIHRALNGTYTSLSDIEETINDFAINDYKNTSNIEFAKVYGKYIWKCPKCEGWGGKNNFMVLANKFSDFSWCSMCKNCNDMLRYDESVWSNVCLYPEDQCLGTIDGGNSYYIDDDYRPTYTKLGDLIKAHA